MIRAPAITLVALNSQGVGLIIDNETPEYKGGALSMWRPSASLDAIKARAESYAQIRAFFMSRSVTEVDTPIMGRATATDPHLASFELHGTTQTFLQTSPEFPMKRLLASGSGDIYQICKAFRCEEVGARHNTEFTMLEWYRLGMSLEGMMDEAMSLVSLVLGKTVAYEKLSYREAFSRYLGIDPFNVRLDDLANQCRQRSGYDGPAMARDDYLGLLLADHIEPNLGLGTASILHSYPASQASLARISVDEHGQRVAQRFELYLNGLEIANAYDELQNVDEQRLRFEEDNRQRIALGLPSIPIDENLLEALSHGMPACSGIALGVDRLLMVKLGANTLDEVLAFPKSRA